MDNLINTDKINQLVQNSTITNNKLICPYCNEEHKIVKNGKNKETQRYLCKHCGKSFIKNTNTPVYYSKKSINLWTEYIDLLKESYSLRKIAKILSISINTAFFWRHKLLDSIRENLNTKDLINDVEINKISFKPCCKGNYSKENYNSLHNFLGTGLNICVLTATDSYNHIIADPVTQGILKVADITRFLIPQVKKCNRIITETLFPYHYICGKFKIEHICIRRSSKIESANTSQFNLNKITNIQKHIKNFLKSFRGVSSKYLANYLHLYKYLEEKIISDIIFIKGSHSYIEKNFKGRMPIFS